MRSILSSGLSLVIACLLSANAMQAAEPPARGFIAADSSKHRVAIIDESGNIAWEHKIGPLHDLHVLSNGNVLCQLNWTTVAEINPKNDQIVWQYDAAAVPENKGYRIEIHAFQRLDNGNTMVVESGRSRILELDADNNVVTSIPLKVEHPSAHRDTRLVRKLDTGNYLVCHEADGAVREYSPAGRVVWEYKVPLFGREPVQGHGVEAFGNQCFSAVRLKNGNTLIGTGNGHAVIEVTPAGQDVWSIHQNDLPGVQLAWVTSLQVLPSGNILINNCHAGPGNPQLIEVDRQRNVVWTYRDFDRFGDSLTNSQMLSVDGKPVRNFLR
ncbi:MAG: PQQ-binding-like beta-propeller repeat protein [Planctomycetaceae bacterium]|nr:PQQ-binding-like beta-propeller repeat protein [Planctomycetaceae bacterium]